MRPSTYNVTIGDQLPKWAMIAMMFFTLVLEVVDIARSWGSSPEVMITTDQCYHLCTGWVGSWGPQQCSCAVKGNGG